MKKFISNLILFYGYLFELHLARNIGNKIVDNEGHYHMNNS